MLDALCDDAFNPCDSNMKEQDWENLGTVVDLDSEIPWSGLPSEGGETSSSGADLSTAHNAPLHFSNENQDEFDISWLGTKQKPSVHLQFSSTASETIGDCGFEAVTGWSGLPPQRIPVSISPKTLRKPNALLEQACDSQESSDEDNFAHDADDSLPLIEDDSCSQLPVHRAARRPKHGAPLYDADDADAPAGLRRSLSARTSAPITMPLGGHTALFTLHLFVAALAEGIVEPDTPERTLGILDQVPALHAVNLIRYSPLLSATHSRTGASRRPARPGGLHLAARGAQGVARALRGVAPESYAAYGAAVPAGNLACVALA